MELEISWKTKMDSAEKKLTTINSKINSKKGKKKKSKVLVYVSEDKELPNNEKSEIAEKPSNKEKNITKEDIANNMKSSGIKKPLDRLIVSQTDIKKLR